MHTLCVAASVVCESHVCQAEGPSVVSPGQRFVATSADFGLLVLLSLSKTGAGRRGNEDQPRGFACLCQAWPSGHLGMCFYSV